MEQREDEALIERVKSRDEGAFALIYDRYERLAYSLARRILGDDIGAEDVVQEVFLDVWRRAESFDARRGRLRTWLLSMVHHRSIDAVRRRRGLPTPDSASLAAQAATDVDDVWKAVAASVDAEAVRGALDSVPEEQRRAIELAYFGGYTHREIADVTGVPLGTVKGRIRIGMEKLRGLLVDQG